MALGVFNRIFVKAIFIANLAWPHKGDAITRAQNVWTAALRGGDFFETFLGGVSGGFRFLKSGIITMFLLTAAFIVPVLAQDISIEVELSSKRVPLGAAAQLTITVNGATDIDPIQLPAIDSVDVQYLGPSTRVSIVNGQYSSSKAFTYSLFPHKEGQFQIPAFTIMMAGKSYTVESIPFEVVSDGNAGPAAQQEPATLEDKIFLVLKTSKPEVYINERLQVKIMLFVSGVSASDIQFPQLDNVGFVVNPTQQPKQYQQMVNGVAYDIVEFDFDVFPTREGDLNLGPAKMGCNILVQGPDRRSRMGGPGSLFDDDFFNSFFGQYEKRPIQLQSPPALVKVLPLPQEGRPADFSGAVGQYSFSATVSPSEVKVGDPLTLRMTVKGNGNSSALAMPSLPGGSTFKIYDPQVSEQGDMKKTEQVIIPESDQITQVPAIPFSYFDPVVRQYKTITQGPFPITVKKLEEGEGFKFVGPQGNLPLAEPETLGQDIVFIKSMPGRLRIKGRYLYNNIFYYLILIMFGVMWSAALIYYNRKQRIQTDSVYARRLQAPRHARKGLSEAKAHLAAGNKERFYDTVFKTLQRYLGNKIHLSSGAVTFETVETKLAEKSVDPNVIFDLRSIFEECDMIRYASLDFTHDKMAACFKRLEHVIDYLERVLK